MKKLLVIASLALATSSVFASTFWNYGTLYGNICRNGIYYTIYPMSAAQPVGSLCPIRDGYGNIVGQGTVSDE